MLEAVELSGAVGCSLERNQSKSESCQAESERLKNEVVSENVKYIVINIM